MNFYKTIKQKLAVNVVIVVLAFIITAAFVQVFTTKMINGSLNMLLSANSNRVLMSTQNTLISAHGVVLSSRFSESQYDAHVLRLAADDLQVTIAELKELRKDIISDEARNLADAIMSLSSQTIDLYQRGAQMMVSGASASEIDQWYENDYEPVLTPFLAVFKKAADTLKIRLPMARDVVIESKATVTKINVGLIVFFVLLTGFLLGSLAKNLGYRVQELKRVMESIKNGNLAEPINITGKDEITDISLSLDQLVRHVESLVTNVQGRMVEVNHQSAELENIVVENSQNSELLNDQMSMLSTAMTEMGYTVGEVAKNAEGAASNAQQANSEASEGEKLVASMAQEITSLNTAVGEATHKVNQLSDNTTNISSILDVIRGIAEQTNLLALNAAIEAARAGEQGRGFAVVADEVRTLATRTQESTNEIAQVISGLQQNTSETVSLMADVAHKADTVAGNTKGAETSLLSIVSSVDQISMMNSQIATAAEEQSATANEINMNVSEVVELANVQNAKTQQAGEISKSLHSSAEYVDEQLGYFKH